jgi:hypothetical protein
MYHLADLDACENDHFMGHGSRTHGSKPAQKQFRRLAHILGAPSFSPHRILGPTDPGSHLAVSPFRPFAVSHYLFPFLPARRFSISTSVEKAIAK